MHFQTVQGIDAVRSALYGVSLMIPLHTHLICKEASRLIFHFIDSCSILTDPSTCRENEVVSTLSVPTRYKACVCPFFSSMWSDEFSIAKCLCPSLGLIDKLKRYIANKSDHLDPVN